MQKKLWQKPALIVLIRGNPDEALLLACKGGPTGGPATQINLCSWMNYPPGGCIDLATCSTVAMS